MHLLVFGIYLFLACYLSGNMVTLQFQHYGIYRFAPKEGFDRYMRANNRSALIPSVLPGQLMLLITLTCVFSDLPSCR